MPDALALTMKAVRLTAYGQPEGLHIVQLPRPVPRKKEVLIRVYAATVTLGDCELRSLTLPLWTRIPIRLWMGYSRPKNFTPGMELAGVIESVGNEVTRFKPGDKVFGSSGFRMGSNAEYICLSEKAALAHKPEHVSFEQAATTPIGGINALHFLRKANIQPGQHILIVGAGGSIGTYGVQLAKLYGARVTAVDSGIKKEMLLGIGADHFIDYTQENFWDSGTKYDIIFDMVYTTSFDRCMDTLTPEGTYLMANPGPRRMLKGTSQERNTRKKVIWAFAGETIPDLEHLAELIGTGKLNPVIDKRFTLDQIVEAHRYVEMGLKKGNLILDITRS